MLHWNGRMEFSDYAHLVLLQKHLNPCFLKVNEGSEYTPLARDQWVELHHGNHIGLLPECLRYRVEIATTGDRESEAVRSEAVRSEAVREQAEKRTECLGGAEEMEGETGAGAGGRDPGDDGSHGGDGSHGDDTPSAAKTEEIRPPVPMATSTGKKRTLPSWLCEEAGGVDSSAGVKASAGRRGGVSRRRESEASSNKPSAKKKPAAIARSPSPTPAAQPSSSQHGSTTDSSPPPAKVARVAAALPPPCPYGADCYRKNPAHLREYTHEASADDRPECPYGAECYRKNPAHRKNFKHTGPPASPPAPRGPPQTRPKRTKKRVSALAGDSDDSEQPNTYDYTDSFIDDASDSTSYGGGSEDSEWAPPPQPASEQGEGEEEDVGALAEEANSFISNKKMWRP